ncbi:MAG: hypothetical protein IPM29_31930 [Planctomycetes bacterium]|nr:hypothetical protein [Planctomycetota bacterium]
MQQLLRWIAAAKDIPLEPGSELHLELAGFPAGGLGLLVLVGILLALFLVASAYRRDAHRLSRGRRLVLTTLRGVAVLLAVLLLLDPRIVAVRREVQPGHTLLLIDVSQSMGHTDGFERPEVAGLAASWREVGVAQPGETPRIELVRKLLERDDGALLARLRERNKVLVYGIGATAEPIGVLDRIATPTASADPDSPPGAATFDPGELRADGAWSNLGGGLREALGRSGNAQIAGVVLLSDGRRNLGPLGPETARILRNRSVPRTLVVPVGDPSLLQTLRIARLEAPDKVFQRDPFRVSAAIEGEGYDDVEFEVQLLREGPDGARETVRTTTARVARGAETVVEFDDLRVDQPGVAEWTVEIAPPRFEPFTEERHRRRARIEALAERTRVLLLAGGPSHEYRILRNLLTRDDTIELACWLQSASTRFPQDGNVSLEELPKEREELAKFDVFVLIDPDPHRLDRSFAELVAEQVTRNGAGLWWVCGETWSLDALSDDANTRPLAELLPVTFDLRAVAGSVGLARGMLRAWRYRLTPEGTTHKAARIAADRNESASLWQRLPGFYFAFPVDRAKPAAQVLIEHTRADEAGGARTEPLIATQIVGVGRVLFSATDDTYRWRKTEENAYDRFWVKGIRYLYEGRLGAGTGRLRLGVDETEVELGQAVRVLAEARTTSFEPRIVDAIRATLRDEAGHTEELRLEPIEGQPGQYQAWVRPRGTGFYRVEALPEPGETDGDGQGNANAQTGFQVVPAAVEKEGPVDVAELAAIAGVPGGTLVERPADLLAAADTIRAETRIQPFTSSRTLWDSWYSVILLTAVLACEWWLRKRSNLL